MVSDGHIMVVFDIERFAWHKNLLLSDKYLKQQANLSVPDKILKVKFT